MNRMTRASIIYLAFTLTAALAVLGTTLWLYIIWDEKVTATFSAAVVNTAATLAAATFVGVFDMFFTIQQMRQNEENQRQWRAEMQEERAKAEERVEKILEDFRSEREQNHRMIADLLARNLELNTRLLELLERRNGNRNGSGEAT